MDSIEELSSSSSSSSSCSSSLAHKILIGVPLDERASLVLLSWAIRVIAKPNDTIVALHILVGKYQKGINSDINRFRQAKASVISMLGEFSEMCQNKQVQLEAKVRSNSDVGRGLTNEATQLKANFLLLGGSRKSMERSSFQIVKYCFNHAPEGCTVIAVAKQSLTQHDNNLEISYEASHSSSSRGVNKDIHIMTKAFPSLQKLLGSKVMNRDKRHTPTKSIYEKSSPVAILDGPEGGGLVEECFSPPSKDICRRSRRTNSWRRLSIVKILLPLFHSAYDLKEIDRCSSICEDEKPSLRCFTYEEISHATNSFDSENMVGRGGYAEVFKGELYNGQSVAVKRLAKGNTDENKEREFLTELGIIGHVSHPNTSFLIGCCIENGLHLIFDFSTNGTLASALHSRNSKLLEWPIRYKIAVGIARGLHYLHKCCRRRIIHRDIKASNVLLGPDFEPQISDFGLAKWLPKQWTHHYVIPIEGTFGYLAPEYFMHGIVDEKTDVFAFGVLLLEIVTGRRPIDSSKQNMLLWARPLIESGNLTELVDQKLRGNYDSNQLQRLVLTASYCVRQSSIWRPSMSEVLQLLTDGHDSQAAESWRMTRFQADDMDDFSVVSDFGTPY